MVTILDYVKAVLCVNDNVFDAELLSYINGQLSTMKQLGLLEFDNLLVDNTTVWPFVGRTPSTEENAKAYLAAKVRNVFDPTSSATIREARDDVMNEQELRILIDTSEEVV